MNRLTITAFVADDRTDLLSLWRRSFADYPDDPERQLDLALDNPSSAVFVARDDGMFAGTAMAGCDGIRGWLHYIAVTPQRRNRGIARAMVRHCEAWLAAKGISKIKLQLRADNLDVRHVYEHLGYAVETHVSMAKRIRGADAAPLPPVRSGEPGCIDVVVNRLEMLAPPSAPQPKPPALKLAVLRAENITVAYYRFLYAEVGRDWTWYERRSVTDSDLAVAIQDPQVDVFVLHVGGQPAGYIELDRRRLPDEVEIRFFGLMPDFIGRGLGPWLLDWGVREAWRHAPRRTYVNTCSLDHPKALALYQRMGFTAFKQESKTIRDPRPFG